MVNNVGKYLIFRLSVQKLMGALYMEYRLLIFLCERKLKAFVLESCLDPRSTAPTCPPLSMLVLFLVS